MLESGALNLVPRVSIGMPVYNGERFMRQAFDSLLGQTFTDFELIVSDNCSSDASPLICREYETRDHRVRYIRQTENIGACRNFNFLLREARGSYFMWAACDDDWDREFIQRLVEAIEFHKGATGAFCPYAFMDERDRMVREPRYINYLGRTAFVRLLKFCWYYDDGCFYGLYHRKALERVHVPTWWRVNARTPSNNAYPVIAHFLASGNHILAGSSPMWFNRLHEGSQGLSNRVGWSNYCAFVALKLNVCYECLRNVYLGSRSFSLVALVLPVFLLRFTFDCLRMAGRITPVIGPTFRSLRRVVLRAK